MSFWPICNHSIYLQALELHLVAVKLSLLYICESLLRACVNSRETSAVTSHSCTCDFNTEMLCAVGCVSVNMQGPLCPMSQQQIVTKLSLGNGAGSPASCVSRLSCYPTLLSFSPFPFILFQKKFLKKQTNSGVIFNFLILVISSLHVLNLSHSSVPVLARQSFRPTEWLMPIKYQ